MALKFHIKIKPEGRVIFDNSAENFNSSKRVNVKTPNFATFNIFWFERVLENFMLLPFIILEIFTMSKTNRSNSNSIPNLAKLNYS